MQLSVFKNSNAPVTALNLLRISINNPLLTTLYYF